MFLVSGGPLRALMSLAARIKSVEEMQREREGTETSFKALRKSGCAGRREDIAEEGEVG